MVDFNNQEILASLRRNTLKVHIDPNGCEVLVIASTLDEAIQAIRERYPNAVHNSEWMMDAGDLRADDRWFNAVLEFWPDRQTMVSDTGNEWFCALVFSDSIYPPAPGAQLYCGDINAT